MIKLENYEVVGWEHAIRGMRNPMNSWDKSDSKLVTQTLVDREIAPGVNSLEWTPCKPYTSLGPNDHELMMKLRNAGTDHRKFLRMITVYVDITAPLYWWKEFDTYKVGTVANSCSTMHKIHSKEFELEDFSVDSWVDENGHPFPIYCYILEELNYAREHFLETNDKKYWKRMIQLLPTSYNQRRTVMLNYEVLANMYKSRKNHKLDEWHAFCDWIEKLPYSELITGNLNNKPDFTNHDGSHDYD